MKSFVCLLISCLLLTKVSLSSLQLLPVMFYSQGQVIASATANEFQWLLLTQCQNSTANLPLIQLTIIQPENAAFVSSRSSAVVEISQCPNSFSSSCIIGTNYVKTLGTVQGYNNITIPYNKSVSTLAIRVKSEIGATPVSLYLTYVSTGAFKGVYDYTVFNTDQVPISSPTYFSQYVKLNSNGNVVNQQYNYYFLSFCEKDITTNTKYYNVNIQVSNSYTTPLAAFDLVGCSAYSIGNDYKDYCTVENEVNGNVIAEDPASVISITMDSQKEILTNGIYVGVYGYGGDLSGNNGYSFLVTEQGHS